MYAETVEGSVAALRAPDWVGEGCRRVADLAEVEDCEFLAEESVWVRVSGGSRQEHGLRQEQAELTSYVNFVVFFQKALRLVYFMFSAVRSLRNDRLCRRS